MNRTLIIAEAGVNHNGHFDLAIELVDAAANAGADVIKFQTFQASKLATSLASTAAYQKKNLDKEISQLEMLRSLELSLNDHIKLQEYCQTIGIEFLSSAFDQASLEFLTSMRPSRWKIPSGEITNLPYIKYIGSLKMPVILSTGMSTLGEIEQAINLLESSGTPRRLLTVLQCTTQYPAPYNQVNLLAMQTIAKAFNVPVGYSDHTNGIAVPIAAVALGAVVIEKHLTLSRDMDGPDHLASLEPTDFQEMVNAVRSVEIALGTSIKSPSIAEQANIPIVRKSIVASDNINSGELFTSRNITVKRPGTGISPMYWDSLIGRRAKREYIKDDFIEW